MRVDYANTLAVYTIEYAQCNSNYGSIGGTTSTRRVVRVQAYTGRRVEDADRISFHQRRDISASKVKHHLRVYGE